MNPCPEYVYAVILAGGSGTRFWPRSRHQTPKQLCKIGSSSETMIEATLSRLDGWIPPERRIVVTHQDQVARTAELIGGRVGKILAEPDGRNTANALAFAAIELKHTASSSKDPVMISLHADSLVADVAQFQRDLLTAVAVAERGYLTLIGVVPDYPETGYGYIELGAPLSGVPLEHGVYEVAKFREKPDAALARDFVQAGGFLWNTGVFVWPVALILEELQQYLPGVVEQLEGLMHGAAQPSLLQVDPQAFANVYQSLPRIAIDHAVVEVSRRVAVVKTAFGWHDVGTWGSLDRCFSTDDRGNLTFGDGALFDCHGVTVDSDGPFVAGLGLEDLVIVAAGGAVLVCPKERSQDVKTIVAWLQQQGRHDLT